MAEGNLSDHVLRNSTAPEHHQPLRQIVRRLPKAIACGAIGFACGCGLLRLVLPKPIDLYAEVRSEKIALARQWAGVVSMAVFGSSHVDCGFDPRSFDEALSPGAAHPISVNLGVLGGVQIEQAAVAREYVKLVSASPKPKVKPQILLMESNINVNFTNERMTHPRSINVYDFDGLRLAAQFSDPKLGLVRAIGRSGVALFGFVLNSMNVGMLSNLIFHRALDDKILANQSLANRRGLSPPTEPATDKDRNEILAAVAGAKAPPKAVRAEITPGFCAESSNIAAASPAISQDLRIIYFVTPKMSDLRSYDVYPPEIACGSRRIPIVNVALPLVNPELYNPDIWFDPTHLNERGAALYSRLLALAVKRTLDASTLASL